MPRKETPRRHTHREKLGDPMHGSTMPRAEDCRTRTRCRHSVASYEILVSPDSAAFPPYPARWYLTLPMCIFLSCHITRLHSSLDLGHAHSSPVAYACHISNLLIIELLCFRRSADSIRSILYTPGGSFFPSPSSCFACISGNNINTTLASARTINTTDDQFFFLFCVFPTFIGS